MSRIIKNPFERKQKGIAVLYLNFLKQLVLAVLVVLFLPISCTKNPPEEPEELGVCITMTTQASELYFLLIIPVLLGSDTIVVDWGDGKNNMTYFYPNLEPPILPYMKVVSFSHSYSDASEHTITIMGDSIESLYCAESQLIALDVSHYSELKGLTCWGNQLTGLDLSKNIVLQWLCCDRNPLTTLDVSSCTALETLWVRECPLLTTLDVSNCNVLTHMLCYENRLASLDVSSNTELAYLACGYNQLTASALNDLFRALSDKTDMGTYGNINIIGNPGASDCDFSIAAGKGWKQWYPGPKSMDMKGSEEMYLYFLQRCINNKNKKYEE